MPGADDRPWSWIVVTHDDLSLGSLGRVSTALPRPTGVRGTATGFNAVLATPTMPVLVERVR